MNCTPNYQDLLIYLEQAENDITHSIENNVSQSGPKQITNTLSPIKEEMPKKHNQRNNKNKEQTSVELSTNSDPEDMQLNLEMLLKINETIKADLLELLENHNNGCETRASCSIFEDLEDSDEFQGELKTNRFEEYNKDFHNSNNNNDEKQSIDSDFDTLSDLASNSFSTISTVHVATQTSPSLSESSTNLTVASSSPQASDTESSEESDIWGIACNSKTVLNSGKSSSAPILEKVSPSLQVSWQSRSQSDRHLAEIEAAEACKWLRATGFPQYAQMYEDMQFPIDTYQAAQDHEFLEPDVLHSLFRRLQILNNCAHLHQQQHLTHTDESDDECCALSDNWIYQSETKRWSRNCNMGPYPNLEEINKRLSTDDNKDTEEEVFENFTPQNAKDKLKRTGSNKFRRRRRKELTTEATETTAPIPTAPTPSNYDEQKDEPVSDRKLSVLANLKSIEINHISDSEGTPKHQRKIRANSFDKTEVWLHVPRTVVSPIWKNFAQFDAKYFDKDKRVPVEPDNGSNSSCSSSINSYSSSTSSKEEIPICQLSAAQLQMVRKLALLKLTTHMEKYCPSHRSGWNWDLPKFLRKMKSPIYKDKNIFGVPLTITLQRTGQVLPRHIEEALRWLQRNATDQVGIFRKPGVKSRIQALRNLVEFNVCVDFSDQQSYDVADMVKQYFRELPETLLTNKLSETFILIFQHVPLHLRRESVLCTLLLMPDEHIEVLQLLLDFLLSIAKHSEVNQMNESNLAMCFAPSLFHYTQTSNLNNSSHKQNIGSPHPKELAENKAAYDCLFYFLKNFKNLFNIPQEFINQCKSSELKPPKAKPLSDLTSEYGGGWRDYLKQCQKNLIKEAKEKQRGWVMVPGYHPRIDIAYKKVAADGIPLRLWKVCVEIEAPPSEILHTLLRERELWDPELRSAKIVAQLEMGSEIFQFVRNRLTPLVAEEYCVVRTWRTDLPRDACLLVETSVEHPDASPIPQSIRGLVLASRYFIEPCGSGKTRVLHLSRVDSMGRSPEWYRKHFGHLQASFLANIQNSFSHRQSAAGPESKV